MSSTGNLRAGVLSLLLCGLLAGSLTPATASASPRSRTASAPAPACASAAARRAHTSERACPDRRDAVHARNASSPAARPRHGARSRKIVKHARGAAAAATPNPSGEATEPQATQASAATIAATIAAVLANACQNTELTPEAANIALVRAAVLCLINRKRAENAELPLTPNPQLEAAAEGHCQEMIAEDYFAHVSPSGETPVDRIRETGYIPNANVGYVIGENLAWGTYNLSTPASIVAAWIASPGHLANILEANYRDTGIAVTPAVPSSLAQGAPGATYAQEFGVIVQ